MRMILWRMQYIMKCVLPFNMKLLGEDNNCSEKLMIINISNDLKEFPVGEYSIDSINS